MTDHLRPLHEHMLALQTRWFQEAVRSLSGRTPLAARISPETCRRLLISAAKHGISQELRDQAQCALCQHFGPGAWCDAIKANDNHPNGGNDCA